MVPGLLLHGFIGFRFVSGLLEFIPRIDPGKDGIKAVPWSLLLIESLHDLPQFFFEVVGDGFIVLVVFIRIRIGVPLDEHRVGDLFRRDTLLSRAGDVVKEKGLDDLDALVAVNLQVTLGQTVDLALAGLVSPIVRLPFRFDGHQPGMDATRVLLVSNGLVEQFPQADELPTLILDLMLQGLMHEMDRGAGRGQFIRDSP